MPLNLDLYPEFWTDDISVLNVALDCGIQDWYSRYGQFAYRLTTEKDPFEGIPVWDFKNGVPATIPDPEFPESTELITRVGKMTIAKINSEDKNRPPIIRNNGYRNKYTPVKATHFLIDVSIKEAKAIEAIGLNILEVEEMKSKIEYEQDLLTSLESLKQKLC